jgi:hypothetical protein
VQTEYLRNHIRTHILPTFTTQQRQQLLEYIRLAHLTNQHIDTLLASQLQQQLRQTGKTTSLDRDWFIMLPHIVARELLAAWWRQTGITNFDRKLLESATIAAKTFSNGKQFDISGQYVMIVGQDNLTILPRGHGQPRTV